MVTPGLLIRLEAKRGKTGRVAATLMARAADLLAAPPVNENVDAFVSKLPAETVTAPEGSLT